LASKILLVDDSVTAQNLGRKILADAGYEVITVNSGAAALKKVSEQRPDLIVLDVYMPGYSGFEVCQRLKEVPDTSRIPILLTVGKLQPFKPEEARRARADGFIVKPFEASELLSALSKLEDKVSPRGETSRSGRFARATAPVEDKTMAEENDSRWKTRIVLPKKKTQPAEQEAADPAAYAPVHKDVQGAGKPKPGETVPASAEAGRIDLGALAQSGLPKDVTPEETAAMAAAAAQVKGSLAEEKASRPLAEMPVVAPGVEAPKAEVKSETPAAEPEFAPASQDPALAVSRTFAAQAAAEKAAQVGEKEPEPAVPATPALSAAVASPEAEVSGSQAVNSGNGRWSPSAHGKAGEPVTMAAADAAANPVVAGPRWTAAPVALAPEAGISLEQEMQRVDSGYAAAEADHTATSAIPEMTPPAAMPAPGVATPAEVAPEAALMMSAVASAAAEALSAGVAELGSVAAAYATEKAAPPATTPEVPEAAVAAMPVSQTAQTTVPPAEAKAEPISLFRKLWRRLQRQKAK